MTDLLAALVLEALVLAALALRRATAALREAHRIRALLQDVRRPLANKTNRTCSLAKCLAQHRY